MTANNGAATKPTPDAILALAGNKLGEQQNSQESLFGRSQQADAGDGDGVRQDGRAGERAGEGVPQEPCDEGRDEGEWVNARFDQQSKLQPLLARIFEGRFGDVVREELHIDPASLTAEEAGYLAGFRDADALRARIAKAVGERRLRLGSKGIAETGLEGGLTGKPPRDLRATEPDPDALVDTDTAIEREDAVWDRLVDRLEKLNIDERVRLSVMAWIDLRGHVAGQFGTIGNGEADSRATKAMGSKRHLRQFGMMPIVGGNI